MKNKMNVLIFAIIIAIVGPVLIQLHSGFILQKNKNAANLHMEVVVEMQIVLIQKHSVKKIANYLVLLTKIFIIIN